MGFYYQRIANSKVLDQNLSFRILFLLLFINACIHVYTKFRLIDYLRFYVPLKNFSLIWRRHHCRWRATKFRPMLGAQGLWAGRDLYRATPAVRKTAPFCRLLRHTRGCGGSILTRILTGTKFRKINKHFIHIDNLEGVLKCKICTKIKRFWCTILHKKPLEIHLHLDLCSIITNAD
jgi:hypothetical protein